jgi:deoxyribodipyrimidine photolyase-related protein
MTAVALVYPHQLFQKHPALDECDHFFIIEDPLFFKQYAFHKHKLILHRASMQMYKEHLEEKGKKVTYISAEQIGNSDDVLDRIGNAQELVLAEPDDDWLEMRLRKAAMRGKLKIKLLQSPGFVTSLETSKQHFESKSKFFMGSYYQEQRKRLDILIARGKPVGGKWSFDTENRKRLPREIPIPRLPPLELNQYVDEAKKYVELHFSSNPGSVHSFNYPTTFSQADSWLNTFLSERFASYGDHQDSIARNETFLFHSMLSSSLNTGLLTADFVVRKALEHSQQFDIPMNSLEGFIRQIIGWREYVRAVYSLIGRKERTTNFWKHSRKIPPSFWSATTGIEPLDIVIQRVLDTGYCHHIERLMIVGNFMLLCEFDPDEVYRWFMELFIDSYDWVMVPNVYGMSQYADGGMIVTKPYISSSNYVLKMSDFKPGLWCETWDGLYWHFVHEHRMFFERNPRLGMMARQLDRMDKEKLNKHLNTAKKFLKQL